MLTQGQVGLPNYGDGSNPNFTQGRQGELLASELHGRYYTQAFRGNMFQAATGSITIASTHVSPLAAGSGTPILGLWNPLNSGRNLVLLKHWLATVSGTPGGPILWNYATNQVVTATPNGQAVPSILSGASPSVAKVFANTALTGSGVGAVLRHAALLPAVAAAYSVPSFEEDAGDVIVPPGGLLTLAAFAAGTSHVVQASLAWEEVSV